MSKGSTLDHVAIAVKSLKEMSSVFESLGCIKGKIEEVPDQDVRVQFFETGEGHVELLEPLSPDGPVGKFIAKNGPGLHHICLCVDDIRKTLKSLKDKGFSLINPEPVVGAGGKLVAFIHPKSTGSVLVELVQK